MNLQFPKGLGKTAGEYVKVLILFCFYPDFKALCPTTLQEMGQ